MQCHFTDAGKCSCQDRGASALLKLAAFVTFSAFCSTSAKFQTAAAITKTNTHSSKMVKLEGADSQTKLFAAIIMQIRDDVARGVRNPIKISNTPG